MIKLKLQARKKIKSLVGVLLDGGYFATSENAIRYVNGIILFINSIDSRRHRPTRNKNFDSWYCEYKPNRRTTWFITFDKEGDKYVVHNIINNHTRDYLTFIRDVK